MEHACRHPVTLVVSTAALVSVAALAPFLFWLGLCLLVGLGCLFLVYRHTTGVCVVWLLVTGATVEMTLIDVLGPAAFQPAIAWIKAAGILLAAVCALRWGLRTDPLNPAWGFAAVGVVGLAHGLYPGLSAGESVRSFVGSVAPFAFCFVRLPQAWAGAILAAVRWCPVAAVAAGALLALIDVRPLFVDSGGVRLSGIGHPAFLASVTLPAIYAGLIALYRDGRLGHLCLLAANLVILLATGARAPTACAMAVIGLSLLSVRSDAFPARFRAGLLLAGLTAVPVLLLFAGDLTAIRLFNLLSHDAGNLSGREYLWAPFRDAAAGSPWFGWGLGAGNLVIPADGHVARLLNTWAVHNEYLRIQVEAGYIGGTLLILMFTGWVVRRTAPLPAPERRIMRFAFLGLAMQAVTDNVMISTPACVLFTFAAAVFNAADGRRAEPAQFGLPDSVRLA